MQSPQHRYLHMDTAAADLVIGPVMAGAAVALVVGLVFFAGYSIGGRIEYRRGQADTVEAVSADIETSIQEGKEIVMKRGRGQVRYRVMSYYHEDSTSF